MKKYLSAAILILSVATVRAQDNIRAEDSIRAALQDVYGSSAMFVKFNIIEQQSLTEKQFCGMRLQQNTPAVDSNIAALYRAWNLRYKSAYELTSDKKGITAAGIKKDYEELISGTNAMIGLDLLMTTSSLRDQDVLTDKYLAAGDAKHNYTRHLVFYSINTEMGIREKTLWFYLDDNYSVITTSTL